MTAQITGFQPSTEETFTGFLGLGPVLAVVCIRTVNQQMGTVSLSLYVSLINEYFGHSIKYGTRKKTQGILRA